MNGDLVIQGSLENTTLPDLLRSVCSNKETGELTFTFLDSVKSIYVSKGRIIFATSNNPDDRLGEVLLKKGEITVKQYKESAELIRPGKKQGTILCDLGYLSPEDIMENVKYQVQEIIYSIFNWTRGSYSLDLKDLDTSDLIILNMSTEDIIMEGMRRINSWHRIYKGTGPLVTCFDKTAESDQVISNVTMNEEELHIFNLVSGKLTVEQICSMSYLTNLETYRVLWALKSIGAIVPVRKSQESEETSTEDEYELQEIVDKYNRFFSFIYDYFKKEVGDNTRKLLTQCMADVKPQYPEVLKGVDLSTGGMIDFDQIYTNVVGNPVRSRKGMIMGAFNELMYNLVFVTKRELGDKAEKIVSSHLREIKEELM